jgi:hypothetical protein
LLTEITDKSRAFAKSLSVTVFLTILHLMNQTALKAIENSDYRVSPHSKRVSLKLHNSDAARKHLEGTGTSLPRLVDFLLCVFVRQKEAQAKATRRRARKE